MHELPNSIGCPKYTQLDQSWSLVELYQFICLCYLSIPLNLIGVSMARADKSRKLINLNVDELEKKVCPSKLYIVPHSEIIAHQPVNSCFNVKLMFIVWHSISVIH